MSALQRSWLVSSTVSHTWRAEPRRRVDRRREAAREADQVNIVCRLRDAERFIADKRFLRAARTMNPRLMRKGINLNARSHCYDLADLLLADIPISA